MKNELTQNLIEEVVLKHYKLGYKSFSLKTNKREIVKAKRMVWAILKYNSTMSLSDIGRNYHGGTHPNVLKGIRQFESDIRAYRKDNDDFERVINILKVKILGDIKATKDERLH